MTFDITKYGPCEDGLEWYNEQPSFKHAWCSCRRGDWMLWFASKLSIDKRLIVKTAGRCAATVKHQMADNASIHALIACERYGNGEIGDEELSSAAAYAAHAAAYAADAAASAAYATYAADADYATSQKETADICRELLTDVVMEKIKLQA